MSDPIPTDAYYDLTQITDVSISPDGERVAYTTSESDPSEDETVNSIWVVPADGSRDPYRLTRASDAGSPQWSPDSSTLAFTAARDPDPDLRVGRQDEVDETADEEAEEDDETDEASDDAGGGNGDDGPKSQVWMFDMERGGDARQVTDREWGVSDFEWGPDGDRIVVSARDPTEEEEEYLDQREDGGPVETERLQHKFNGTGWLDTVTTYLFVVDVDTREVHRLDDANDGGHGFFGGLEPAWGPSERIAFTANHTEWPDDNYVKDVYLIDPDGGNREQLTESELTAGGPRWSPDGEHLSFTGGNPDNWYVPTEVYVADVEQGGYESVSGSLDRTLAWTGAPRWLDEDSLVALIADEGRSRFVRLHADGETPAERVFEVQRRSESLAHVDVGGETIGFVTSRPSAGTSITPIDAGDLDATETDPRVGVSTPNQTIVDEYPMPETTRVTFESDDGTEVEGIAVHSAEFDPDDPEPQPLILNIHGGPMSYDAPGFSFQDAYFVSRGYLVFKVNYRGSTSYGRDFCEELKGAWGTKDIDDLQAGVDELIDLGWADPDRLFPTGFSQGGVNTAYLVTRDDRWAAAAAEHGVYDLRSDFGTADSQNWYEADYGLPWENPEVYDEHSSITDVGNVETPLLVTAGGKDWRCPPSQSEQLYVSVRKQGVDAKLVVYEDEHHNIGDPDRSIHRLEELATWFERYDPAVDEAN